MFLRTCLKDYSTCFTLGTNLFLTPWWLFLHSCLLKNPYIYPQNSAEILPKAEQTPVTCLDITPVVVQRIGWIALSLSDCSQIWAMCVFLCQCQTPLSYENPVFFSRWKSKNVNFERTYLPRWWFQKFFIFTPTWTWGNDRIWLIFLKWVETTN